MTEKSPPMFLDGGLLGLLPEISHLRRSIDHAARRSRGRLREIFLEVYSRLSSSLPQGYALPPLQVIVELTHRCNLRCSMCFVRRGLAQKNVSRNRRELGVDELLRTIDEFPRSTRFVFTGGEPFARRDFVSILRRTRINHRCGVGTNGTMLTQEQCEAIVDLGVDFLQVSVDGSQEVHDSVRGVRGAFARTVEAIRRIQELKRSRGARRPWLIVNCTITPANVGDLVQVADLARQLGVEYLTFQVVFSSIDYSSGVLVDDELDTKIDTRPEVEALDIVELEHQLRKLDEMSASSAPKISFQGKMSSAEVLAYYRGELDLSAERCIFPWVNAFISPYGEMFPCFNYAIGSVGKQNALALWNNERFRKFRMKLRARGVFPGCLGCCHMRRRWGW